MSTTAPKKKKVPIKDKPNSARLKKLIAEAEPWTENMSIVDFKKKRVRMFTAASYQTAADEFTDWILKAHGLTISDLPVTVGVCQFERLTLPYRKYTEPGWGFLSSPRILDECEPYFLQVGARGVELGLVAFDDDVHVPRLTHPRELHPWMSYTFSEVLSLRAGVRAATGNVLIGGLGMGWMAREVLRKPGVKHVTIVEQDQHILDFFGKAFTDEFGPRVSLIQGDAFKTAESTGDRFDRILVDIWDDYGNQWDPRWRKIVDKFAGTKTKLWQWA